jgi:hypothetical protein
LFEKAIAYLVRGDYRIVQSVPGFAAAEYAGEDRRGRPERILLWVEDQTLPPSSALDEAGRAERAQREDGLLRDMISAMQASPDTAGYYLLPSRQGLSQEFIQRATDTLQRGGRDDRGGIRIPTEFFDTDYKMDGAGAKAKRSALGQVFDRVRHRRRVAQPFMLRTGLGPNDRRPADGDLVEHLDLAFREPVSRATLRIIDGPAGGGKSVAFETLASLLYEEFIEAKRRQIMRARPIVFLPDHIRGEKIGGYVDDIIDATMEAEAARPVEAEQLRFLLQHGHGLWMFDGFDEFFAGDNDFFTHLGNELANPDSRAQFLICTRDSLLTSSSALSSFVEAQLAKGSAIELYEMAPWGPEAWRKLAWMELDAGITGRETSPRVDGFVAALQESPELSQLASLPFYCTVLLEEFRKSAKLSADPLAMLDTIVERMLTREGDKMVFAWREFVDPEMVDEFVKTSEDMLGLTLADGMSGRDVVLGALDGAGRESVREILGFVAHQQTRHGRRGDSIEAEEIRGILGPAYASGAGGDEEAQRVLTALVQFAFFGAGKKAGEIDFSHPILADYLAGRYAAKLLGFEAELIGGMATASPLSRLNTLKGGLRNIFGTAPLEPGSIFERTLKREAARDPVINAFLTMAQSTLADSDTALTKAIGRVLAG